MKVKSEDLEKSNKFYVYQQGINEVKLDFANKFLKFNGRGGGLPGCKKWKQLNHKSKVYKERSTS